MPAWLQRDWCLSFVLALGHFLWQGTLIAFVLAIALRATRAVAVRYWLSIAALLVMAALPVVTLGWLLRPISPIVTLDVPPIVRGEPAPSPPIIPTAQFEEPSDVGHVSNVPVILPAPPLNINTVATIPLPVSADEQSWWQTFAPHLTTAYLCGVTLMLLRLVAGLWGGRRLRRRVHLIDDPSLLEAMRRQAKALGLKLLPILAYCERVTVPTVVGVLRPMILLPVTLTSGLSPEQIESVLAHELAHLRRYDHLVNLLQRVIESLLFFHPAMWWVSHRIREEREHCCDDLVVACGAMPLDYAKSLLVVAELSLASQLRRSVAAVSLLATGHRPSNLRQRIARLLGESATPSLRVNPRALLLAIGIPIVAVIATLQSGASPPPPSLKLDVETRAGSESPRAGRGSPDPALDPTAGLPNSDEDTSQSNNANGDLRSTPAAGSGDPRRAQATANGQSAEVKSDADQQSDRAAKFPEAERLRMLVRGGKIDMKTINASITLVAARGAQDTEFARLVVAEFEKSCEGGDRTSQSRRHLLAVLTDIFEAWSSPGWRSQLGRLKPDDLPQTAPPQVDAKLGREMLARVILHGYETDRSEIANFSFAVRQLHHPAGREFLRDVLRNPASESDPFAPRNPPQTVPRQQPQTTPAPKSNSEAPTASRWKDNTGGGWTDAKFVAAVGLAELGEAEGIDWLLARAQPNEFGIDASLWSFPHIRDSRGSLRECSRLALADLFGLPAKVTVTELGDWWFNNRAKFTARPAMLKLRAGREAPGPALDPTAGLPNADKDTNQPNNANGDLRSNPAAGSGDPRRAQEKTENPHEATLKTLDTDPMAECRAFIKRLDEAGDVKLASMAREWLSKRWKSITEQPVASFLRELPKKDPKEETYSRGELIGVQMDLDGVWSKGKGNADNWKDWIVRKQNDYRVGRLHMLFEAAQGYRKVADVVSAKRVLQAGLAGHEIYDADLKVLISKYWPVTNDEPEKSLGPGPEAWTLANYLGELSSAQQTLGELDQAIETQARLTLAHFMLSWKHPSAGPTKHARELWSLIRRQSKPTQPPFWFNIVDVRQPKRTFDLSSAGQKGQPLTYHHENLAASSPLEFAGLTIMAQARGRKGFLDCYRINAAGKHESIGLLQPLADGEARQTLTKAFKVPAGTSLIQFMVAGDDFQIGEVTVEATFTQQVTSNGSLPKGLEFLALYPKLHGLSLDMTEPQFLAIIKQQELKTKKIGKGKYPCYEFPLGDGHTLIVMFDQDGKCSGIQCVRGEDVAKQLVEVRLVGGPKAEPLPSVKVEFTTKYGHDHKSFGTFTTDEGGWLKASLPVGFYYLHLKSEKEWPYLPLEKPSVGSSAWELNVHVTGQGVEKWLGGKRCDKGFELATNERPARITFILEPAVELVLRAVDVETGEGIAGAGFHEAILSGEELGHPVYGENLGSKFPYDRNYDSETAIGPEGLTDKSGYSRRWAGEQSARSKIGIRKWPAGYKAVEPHAVVSVLGQARVEQVFKFRRIRWAVRVEPDKKKITLGEPLTLTFFVKNATKETRGLELGGDDRNRLGRPESFEVTVFNNEAKKMPVPDVGTTKGGLSSNVLLKPDGETKVELKLSDWATITQPGYYRVSVKRTLKLFPIKAQNGDRIEWGDQPEVAEVAASCVFDVLAPPRSEALPGIKKNSDGPPEVRAMKKPNVLLPDHWIVQAVGFDSGGKELVTASNQSFITIRRWDLAGMKLLSEIKLQGDQHGRAVRDGTLKFSGDRRRVIAATDAYVGIWETATGKLLKQLPFQTKEGIYDCAVDMLDCTPDLSVIVGHRALPGRLTRSYDAHVIVWDGVSGNVLQTVIDKGATDLKAIDLSTDGKRLVTTNGSGAKIWETRTGQLLRSIPNDNTGSSHVRQNVGSSPGLPRSGERGYGSEATSSNATSHVWSVQFSPDGKQLAMGDILGVKLLDATSGKLLQQFEGPYRYSSSGSPGLVFSKDGQRLARLGTQEKAEGDKHRYVVPIWSTRTGARLFELHTEANDAAFSDDGQRLAVVFSDMQQALSVWPLSEARSHARQSVGNSLSNAAHPPSGNGGYVRQNVDGPGPHSRQDRVEENGHYVGKTAAEFIDKFQPTWGDMKLGLQYGIALTKPQRQFRSSERVPLVVFFRNTSDKPIKFDTAPDFFGNTPKVHNAKGEPIAFENIPLLGHIPHYHEKLAPGEALGPFYLNFGLGENPRPGQQNWHPYFKTPVAGQYKLTHSVSINVASQKDGESSKRDDIATGTIEFEIVPE